MRSVVIAAVLIVVLGLTNPTKEDYAGWAKVQLAKQNWLGGVVGALMPTAMIEDATHRTNLLVFSVFETRVADKVVVRTIGIFSTFFTLKSKDAAASPS